MAALKLAKSRGVPVLAIVNVVGSSIARAADYVMYTYAGPEIAVASTKAYMVQMCIRDSDEPLQEPERREDGRS